MCHDSRTQFVIECNLAIENLVIEVDVRRSGPQILLDAGITAIVQPGGSVRDPEVIAAVEAAGASMYVTGVRHFFH